MERILVEWVCLIFLNIISKVLLRNAPSCFCPRKEKDTSCSLRWYWGFNSDQDLLHARQALYKWDIFLDQHTLLFCFKICLRSLILNSGYPHSLIWEDTHLFLILSPISLYFFLRGWCTYIWKYVFLNDLII